MSWPAASAKDISFAATTAVEDELMHNKTIHESMRSLYAARRGVKAIIRHQSCFVAHLLARVLRVSRSIDCNIGFLGCGEIGREVLSGLLDLGVAPELVRIMTRTCSGLDEFEERGVMCTTDPTAVTHTANIVIVAVPPAQLQSVAAAVRGTFRHDAVALSILAGVTEAKVAQLLGLPFVLRTRVSPVGVRALRHAAETNTTTPLPPLKELTSAAAQQFAGADTMEQLAAALHYAGAGGSLHLNSEQASQRCSEFNNGSVDESKQVILPDLFELCVECICEQGRHESGLATTGSGKRPAWGTLLQHDFGSRFAPFRDECLVAGLAQSRAEAEPDEADQTATGDATCSEGKD